MTFCLVYVPQAMHEERVKHLIQRAKARDADAFDELIDGYGPRLYGYLFRTVGSREDAEDLLQDLFLRVVRTIDRYQHQGQFDAWLFRIATNLLRDRGRQMGRQPGREWADVETVDPSLDERVPAPEHDTDSEESTEARDKLGRALGQLTSGEREVLTLRHFSTLSFAEIAEIVHAPLGTVLARSHRGLAKLRSLLEPEP